MKMMVYEMFWQFNNNLMFNLDKFIYDLVTFRSENVFEPNVQANADTFVQQYYKCVA